MTIWLPRWFACLVLVQVVITGNKIVFHNGVDAPEMIVTLRPDKRPKEIDFTLRAGGKPESLLGIYSLEEGELRLCYNNVEGAQASDLLNSTG